MRRTQKTKRRLRRAAAGSDANVNGREELLRRALRSGGKFSSNLKNVSTDHDQYAAEAFLKSR